MSGTATSSLKKALSIYDKMDCNSLELNPYQKKLYNNIHENIAIVKYIRSYIVNNKAKGVLEASIVIESTPENRKKFKSNRYDIKNYLFVQFTEADAEKIKNINEAEVNAASKLSFEAILKNAKRCKNIPQDAKTADRKVFIIK